MKSRSSSRFQRSLRWYRACYAGMIPTLFGLLTGRIWKESDFSIALAGHMLDSELDVTIGLTMVGALTLAGLGSCRLTLMEV